MNGIDGYILLAAGCTAWCLLLAAGSVFEKWFDDE